MLPARPEQLTRSSDVGNRPGQTLWRTPPAVNPIGCVPTAVSDGVFGREQVHDRHTSTPDEVRLRRRGDTGGPGHRAARSGPKHSQNQRRQHHMPMIDVYARSGTFTEKHQLAVDLATTLMKIEGVPGIPMFRKNTAAFVHELPGNGFSNVDGDNSYVRVQVLTNAGALDRDKQLAVVAQFTELIVAAAGDQTIRERTWVL